MTTLKVLNVAYNTITELPLTLVRYMNENFSHFHARPFWMGRWKSCVWKEILDARQTRCFQSLSKKLCRASNQS